MTIEFVNPEIERIVNDAVLSGDYKSPQDVIAEAIVIWQGQRAPSVPPANKEEWLREFRAWVRSHPTDTPLLSDEAISRDSIYRERGL